MSGCRSKKYLVYDHADKRDSSVVLQISADTARWQENSADSVRELTEFVRDSCGQIVAISKTRVSYHQKSGRKISAQRQKRAKIQRLTADSVSTLQNKKSTSYFHSIGSYQNVAKGKKIVVLIIVLIGLGIFAFFVVKWRAR